MIPIIESLRNRRDWEEGFVVSKKRKALVSKTLKSAETNKLYISNIHQKVKKSFLIEYLCKYANVTDIKMVKFAKCSCTRSAIVKVRTKKDVERLLTLSGVKCLLWGSRMTFKCIRRANCNSPGYRPIRFSNRNYDLAPAVQGAACFHAIMDEVVLKIFGHLPLDVRMRMERVCRRWQNLVYRSIKKNLLSANNELNLKELQRSIPSTGKLEPMVKLLFICGDDLTDLKICSSVPMRKMLSAVGQFCPKIETLKFSMSFTPPVLMDFPPSFLTSCKNLTAINFLHGFFFMEEDCIHLLLRNFPNLKFLGIPHVAARDGRCFRFGSNLERLFINVVIRGKAHRDWVLNISDSCPKLQHIKLDLFAWKPREVKALGRSCPLLESFDAVIERDVDLSSFQNLKSLYIEGWCVIDLGKVLQTLKNSTKLEDITIDGSFINSRSSLIDFGVWPHLKSLTIISDGFKWNCSSQETIARCSKLEELELGSLVVYKTAMLKIIRSCRLLNTVSCIDLKVHPKDAAAYVKANAGRSTKLRFGVDLVHEPEDDSLANILEAANYTVQCYCDCCN